MNYSVCFAFSIIFTTFCYSEVIFPSFNKKNILQHSFVIEKMLKRDRIIGRSVELFSLLYNASLLLEIGYFLFHATRDVGMINIDRSLPIQHNNQQPETITKRFADSFKESCRCVWGDVKTGYFFITMLKGLAKSAVVSCTNFGLNSLIQKFSHEHTIDWYMKVHAPYIDTVDTIMNFLKMYQVTLEKGAHDQRIFHLISIMTVLLVNHIKHIVSYMEFRIRHSKKRDKKEMLVIKNYLYSYSLEMKISLQQCLENKDVSLLERLLEQVLNQIEYMIKSFRLYEGRPSSDSFVYNDRNLIKNDDLLKMNG